MRQLEAIDDEPSPEDLHYAEMVWQQVAAYFSTKQQLRGLIELHESDDWSHQSALGQLLEEAGIELSDFDFVFLLPEVQEIAQKVYRNKRRRVNKDKPQLEKPIAMGISAIRQLWGFEVPPDHVEEYAY